MEHEMWSWQKIKWLILTLTSIQIWIQIHNLDGVRPGLIQKLTEWLQFISNFLIGMAAVL